jgi:hypothetical protein
MPQGRGCYAKVLGGIGQEDELEHARNITRRVRACQPLSVPDRPGTYFATGASNVIASGAGSTSTVMVP